MIICNHEQNSDEWIKERLGVPSASCFGKIVTASLSQSKQRQAYMYQLAGEIITGEQHKGYYGKAMERGHEREDESRGLYEIKRGVTVEQVGFCYKDESRLFGASPDGLVGDDGGFETKNAEPHIQAERIHKGWNASEHHRQVMGCLLVTGRKWWDIQSYCRGMKEVVVRFNRDEGYLANLEAEIVSFSNDLKKLVKEISI